jgi:hypothetical protein
VKANKSAVVTTNLKRFTVTLLQPWAGLEMTCGWMPNLRVRSFNQRPVIVFLTPCPNRVQSASEKMEIR